MNRWKGGGLLLLLAIPLGFYAAWHVKGVMRTDMVVSDPPPDRGGTKEQLAESQKKAKAWADDVRKASTVTLQYRGAEPGEKPATVTVDDVSKAAAVRSADLNDLDVFLSNVQNPKFTGKLITHYERWKGELKQANEREQEVRQWLDRPVVVNTATDANRLMSDIDSLLRQYLEGSGFASRKKAAEWRLKARLAVIKELGARADDQYAKATAPALPLKPDGEPVKDARAAFAVVKAQDRELKADEKRSEEDGVDLTPLRGEINERKATAEKCKRHEALLTLYTQPNLFTDANVAVAWLRDVATVYRDVNNPEDRRRIRTKVQQFCEEFVPPAVRLDDLVKLTGRDTLRQTLRIKYKDGGETKRVWLSADPVGLNEFTTPARHSGDTTFVLNNSGDNEYLKNLKPTTQSEIALYYNEVRKAVQPATGEHKWTAKTVEGLKNKCEAKQDLVQSLKALRDVDRVVRVDSPSEKVVHPPTDDPALKLWTRLEGLLEGLKSHPELVEGFP